MRSAFLKSLLILVAVCLTPAFAQIELATSSQKALTGLQAPRIVAEKILVGDESKPVVSSVAIITAKSPAKFLRVKARNKNLESATLEKISDTEWLLSQPGTWLVEAISFDPETGIDENAITVTVGVAPPIDPPVDPQPPVGFAALVAVSKAGCDSLADIDTQRGLSGAILAQVAATNPDVPLDMAKTLIVNAIENRLLRRQGVSRTKDWLNGWRIPVATEIKKLNIADTKTYLAAMKAVAESMQ